MHSGILTTIIRLEFSTKSMISTKSAIFHKVGVLGTLWKTPDFAEIYPLERQEWSCGRPYSANIPTAMSPAPYVAHHRKELAGPELPPKTLAFPAIFHKVPKTPKFWPSDFVENRKWEKMGVSMVPGSNSESLELFFCTVSSRLSRGSHLAPVGTILRFSRKNVFFRDFPQSPSTAFGVLGVKMRKIALLCGKIRHHDLLRPVCCRHGVIILFSNSQRPRGRLGRAKMGVLRPFLVISCFPQSRYFPQSPYFPQCPKIDDFVETHLKIKPLTQKSETLEFFI